MKNGLLDFLQSASNAVAGNVAGPVDLLGMGLNKIGIPVREPVGGSEWMKRKGLMRDVQQGPARVLGETAGLLGPAMVTQFAPQIAKGLLQGADNLAAPAKLSKQAGMIKTPFGHIPENADDLVVLAGKPWFTPDPSMQKKVMSDAAAEKKTAERLNSEAGMMFGHQGVVDFASATEKQKRKILEHFTPYTGTVLVPVEEQKKKFIKEVMKLHNEAISSAHKAGDIDFHAMPLSAFDDGTLIYKSPNYNGRQSSEYRLVVGNDGVPAYARKSNHWGRFTTNIKEGSEQAKALGLTNEHGDPFGRVGYNVHNWDLIGGDAAKKTSQAGSISLADVLSQYFKVP